MPSLTSIGLIIISVLTAFFLAKPMYDDVLVVRADNQLYIDAVNKGKEFEARIGSLDDKRNQFSPEDMDRLSKMVPSDVDSVRLVIELNEIAKKFSTAGMKNILISEPQEEDGREEAVSPYKTVSVSFSVTMTYDRFVEFLKAVESNLRLIDITSLSFTPSDTGSQYDFSITVKTYELKPRN